MVQSSGPIDQKGNISTNFRLSTLILVSSSLFFLLFILTLSVSTFALKLQITEIQLSISAAVTFIYTVLVSWLFLQKNYFLFSVKVFALLILILSSSVLISGFFIDLSYDGQGYHQAGAIALNKGWNPIYENIFDRGEIKSENKLWIESYPHANNILSLNLFKITGNIELGKGVSLFFIVISSLLGFVALMELNINKWLSGILVLILAINPINVLQIFTFGLDTQFYSLITMFLFLGVCIVKNFHRNINLFNLSIVSILLVNNKLTSIAYLFIFSAAFCIFLLLRKEYRIFFKTATVLFFSTAVGLLLIGYQPFFTNYQNHKNIFYPIYVSESTGDVKYDFSENRPSNFLEENQISLFVKSIFFKVNGQFRPPEDKAEYKLPFAYAKDEINSFIYLGPKEGAFGVFFSGIMVLVILLVLVLPFSRKSFYGKRSEIVFASFVIFTVLVSCLINPLNSAYRYIPQFWIIFPIILWVSWQFKSKLAALLSIYIVIVILINSILIFSNTSHFNYINSIVLKDYLHKLSILSNDDALLVNFSQAEGNEFLLDRYGVNYSADFGQSVDFKCPDGFEKRSLLKNIGNSTALVCLTQKDIDILD